MAEKHLSYYNDDWKNEILVCSDCGWSGTFDEGVVEYHSDCVHSSCPTCVRAGCAPSEAYMLAVVSFPTLRETEANLDCLSDFEKTVLASRQRFVADYEARRLRTADQLPDIAAPQITLSWDYTGEGAGDSQTVIRHDEQVVWSEPAVWEGFERFAAVLAILKQKYGARLVDVVPTDASELYLYGDRFSATAVVRQARSNLQGGQKAGEIPP
jgi:hypothetical protein